MTAGPVTGVIGLGRFGGALVRSLQDIGVPARPLDHISVDRDRIYTAWLKECQVICLCVRDSQIEALACELARGDLRGKMFLMHSGTADLELLSPLANKGAITGKFHPLQTFTTRNNQPIPRGTPFAFQGPIREIVAPWVTAWSGSLHQLSQDQWLPYHIAAVTAANFLPVFIRAGASILEPMSRDRSEALAWLTPLVQHTLEAALDGANQMPFSGPAIRNDQKVIELHLDWLARNRPELTEIYRLATETIQKTQVPSAKKSEADVK